eukprot:773646_1
MASSTLINMKLISLIDSATCIQDLTPLLTGMFELTQNVLKDILKQQLSTMDIAQTYELHLKAWPMDDILPHHIVQYMIGFSGDFTVALVNKTFNQCCKSAQRIVLRQQKTDLQQEFNDLHLDLTNNSIINVYPSPHRNMLSLAIEHAQAGDTLLIHEGVYEFQQDYQLSKNIKLIGYGSDVIIKAYKPDDDDNNTLSIAFKAQYTYLHNLTFNLDRLSSIDIAKQADALYMENCTMYFDDQAMTIRASGSVKIKNCVIKGGERNINGFEVAASAPDSLEIESCLFENCCSDVHATLCDLHCIVLWHQHDRGRLVTELIPLKGKIFRCVGNHFKNNFALPIVTKTGEPNVEHIQIMNNTWCYEYDTASLCNVDANKIHPYTRIQR